MKKCRIKEIRAFTLIELLVVVLIISILAAVALPQYQLAVDKAKFSRYLVMGEALYQAQKLYYLENGTYANRLDQLDFTFPFDITECERTSGSNYDRIFCGNNRFGIEGLGTSIEVGERNSILYAKYFQDFTSPTNTALKFQSGKSYCSAPKTSERFKNVCQRMGGTYMGDGTWAQYAL